MLVIATARAGSLTQAEIRTPEAAGIGMARKQPSTVLVPGRQARTDPASLVLGTGRLRLGGQVRVRTDRDRPVLVIRAEVRARTAQGRRKPGSTAQANSRLPTGSVGSLSPPAAEASVRIV